MNDQLTAELQSFQDIWKGGYYEGDPLNPLSGSTFGQFGFMSVLHATYLRCIKPYIGKETVALELGPGRGAWTKALLLAKEVWALDALPEPHNRFFEYLGHPPHVRYFQVQDFKCEMLPDNHFTYMFSFGCLCHVSFSGITEYAVHLFPKLKPGSDCFWMIADYDKYNNVIRHIEKYSIWKALSPRGPKEMPFDQIFDLLMKTEQRLVANQQPLKPDADDKPEPARWFNAGIERTCAMLEKTGYRIVAPDVGTILRDPIIHFRKAGPPVVNDDKVKAIDAVVRSAEKRLVSP